MENEKNWIEKIGPWTTVALTLVYLSLITFYFDYVISQEMDEIIQGAATFLAIFYTWWQIKLVVTQINKLFKKND
jgi:ACR3 family arsenite efflux pump ArsB